MWNYQLHNHTLLEFCPRVNVIIGVSGVGKSCAIRSLETVYTNKPLGLKRRSTFAKPGDPMKIKVVTDDPHTVVLQRDGKDTSYTVDKGKPLRKFGAAVPEEVPEALNIGDLNIQKQHALHYLMVSGPAEITRTINELTGLEALDPALNFTNHRITLCKTGIRTNKTALLAKRIELKSYKALPRLEKLIIKAESLQRRKEETEQTLVQVSADIVDLKRVDKQIAEFEKVDFARCATLLSNATALHKRIGELHQKHDIVLGDVNEAHYVEQQLDVAQKRYKKLKEQYAQMLLELGKCPTCHTKLRQAKIEKIVREL